jgi:hypothetical protein
MCGLSLGIGVVELRRHDGHWVKVESVGATGSRDEFLYNLRLDTHSYFVGDQGWGFSIFVQSECGQTETPAK